MKIKWNWGTKLAIWIVAFVVFMLTLVFMTTTYEINLVEKDYYPKGLKYQNRIDAIKNAKDIGAVFTINQDENNIIVNTPNIKADSGSMLFFRPSENRLDKSYKLVINKNGKIIIPKDEFSFGRYILKINWFDKNNEYYIEQSLYIK